ncbi:unnamed protein product, partial [Closterium sp. NIES-53]
SRRAAFDSGSHCTHGQWHGRGMRSSRHGCCVAQASHDPTVGSYSMSCAQWCV